MAHARKSRHRLAAAVAVTLAVTAGVLTSPAVAATGAGPETAAVAADQQAAAVPTLPQDSQLVGNGPSGFLTRHNDGGFSWTRYADGVTTALPAGSRGTVRADTVVASSGTVHTVYDMSGASSPVTIDIGFLGPDATLMDLVGSTLVVSVPKADGSEGRDVHLVGKPDGTIVDRTVFGLPTGMAARDLSSQVDSPDTLSLLYDVPEGDAAGRHTAVVDVATATVVEERPATRADYQTDVTLSATHLAWAEAPAANGAVALEVARRGESDSTRIPIGYGQFLQTELMDDDWLAYAETTNPGFLQRHPNPLYGLTLRSLTTGQTVKVLDVVDTIRSQSDTELLVQGGTIEQGEGIYRIATGPDGLPAATLVASLGRPVALTLVGEETPTSVDFDTAGSKARFFWKFGRWGADVRLVVTHEASGKRWTSFADDMYSSNGVTMDWTGQFDNAVAAYHGTYTWKMTATPWNGIGPAVERSGTLKVVGKAHPHDYSDSGSPDLLLTNSAGRLSSLDVRQMFDNRYQGPWERTDRGGGWNTYDRIIAPGNLAGSSYADLLGRDRTGALWYYRGTGHSFAPRTKVGSGWQIYDKLTAGSDLTGDGRPDLLATDRSGVLWLYKATGNEQAPFAPRKKIGGGWGGYNRLTATGNLAGGPTGDLVARDASGVLWLYLGKGDGTFAVRTRISGGWNQYTDLVGIGDADKDGRADLLAVDHRGTTTDGADIYRGTGDYRAPFTNYYLGAGLIHAKDFDRAF
ncbi:FG-GAP repeat domain-containing protein [Streptomyces vietnamensis]|uniref:FG-GAP repeat domain-containing protein n=1 Tax=Streptomyces vietnamensis TaxID=362257 RepID=UPI003435B35D